MKSLHRYKKKEEESNLPVLWESKVPKNYKRNTILDELYRAKKISSNFQVNSIKEKLSTEIHQ